MALPLYVPESRAVTVLLGGPGRAPSLQWRRDDGTRLLEEIARSIWFRSLLERLTAEWLS